MSSGSELGMQLGEMWLCGKRDIPHVAETFTGANKSLAGMTGIDAAFACPSSTRGITYGLTYGAWSMLQRELQSLTATSANRMYDAADAFVTLSLLYAETDNVAKDKLNQSYVNDPVYTSETSHPRQDPVE